MKNYIKIISILSGLLLLGAVVYATAIRTTEIQKLPWNGAGSGTYLDTRHHRGSTSAGDVSRFEFVSGTTLGSTGIVNDKRTGLMWQSDGLNNIAATDWTGAINYCSGLTLGGHTDWRLPNIQELMSIVDYSYSSSNYWYETYFTLITNNYWSSTTSADNTSYARYLDFNIANTYSYSKTINIRVICTR